MRLTAQEEYGLRCLLQVAGEPGGFTTVPEVARREGLTRSYVAKLFGILRHADLLESVQGRAGGFRLTRPADRLDVGSVLEGVEDLHINYQRLTNSFADAMLPVGVIVIVDVYVYDHDHAYEA